MVSMRLKSTGYSSVFTDWLALPHSLLIKFIFRNPHMCIFEIFGMDVVASSLLIDQYKLYC